MALIPIYVGRVQELSQFLISLHTAKVAIAAALLLVAYAPRDSDTSIRAIFSYPQMKYILGIIILGLFSVPFSVWPGQSFSFMFDFYWKLIVFMLLLVKSVQFPEDIKKIVWTLFATVAFLVLYSYINPRIVEGNRVSVTVSYDPNDFALFLIMCFPMLFYLMEEEQGIKKMVLIATLVLMLIAIVKTGSRGGFISLCVALSIMFYRKGFKYVLKSIPIFLSILLILNIATGSSSWERFSTILELEDDYNMDARGGRVEIWKRGVNLMLKSPVIGWGIGAFAVAEGSKNEGGMWKTAHNSFIQIGAEIGVAGLALFAMILVKSITTVWRPGKIDELEWFRKGLEVGFYAFCAGGFFLSWAYSYVLYFFIALAIIYAHLNQAVSGQSEPLHLESQFNQ